MRARQATLVRPVMQVRREMRARRETRARQATLVRREMRAQQATLVPVKPGEITSEAGWGADTDGEAMRAVIADLRARGIRVSLFVEARAESAEWAARVMQQQEN